MALLAMLPLVLLVSVPVHEAAAAPPLDCISFTIKGGEMSAIADKSNWQDTGPDRWSFLCNYSGIAGAAITVQYACPADVDAIWQSVAANRDNAVIKSATEVMVREDGGFTTFGGFYQYMEKAFLRIGPNSVATIVLYSNSQAYGSDIKGVTNRLTSAQARSVTLAKCPTQPSPLSSSGGPVSTSGAPPTSASTTTTTRYQPPPVKPLPDASSSSSSSTSSTSSTLPRHRLCDELQGVLGLSPEKIKQAGIDDPNSVATAYDEQGLITDIESAIATFQDRTGQAVYLDNSPPYGGVPGALTFLFSSGGVYDDITSHYIVGKEDGLRGAIIDLSKARSLNAQNPLLTPGDVYQLALELTGGNARDAMLLSHNTLRSLGRAGDKGYTGIDPDPSFFTKHLQPLRDGDEQAGSWYHLFGTAYHSMIAQQDAANNATSYLMADAATLALMAIPGGQTVTIVRVLAGLARVAAALKAASNGVSVVADNPDIANYFEQLYRDKVGGVPPDPIKFCFNVWGSKVGQSLVRGLPNRGAGPAPYSNLRGPGAKDVRGTFLPVSDTSATRFVNVSGSPYAIEWKDGDATTVLDQGANLGQANLTGTAPVVVLPIPEKSTSSWAAVWVAGASSTQTVTLEATKDAAALHLDRIDIDTAQVAKYRATAAHKGDRFTISLDNQKIDPDLRAPDGSIVRPTMGSVVTGGDPTFKGPDPAVVAPTPANSSNAIVIVALATVVFGALVVGLILGNRRKTVTAGGPSRGPSSATLRPGATPAGTGQWGYLDYPVALVDAQRRALGTAETGHWYEVVAVHDDWTQIRMPTGGTGWIPSSQLRRG